MVLEAPRGLRPLEGQEVFFVLSFYPILPSQQYPSDHLMVIAQAKVEVTIVERVFLDGG